MQATGLICDAPLGGARVTLANTVSDWFEAHGGDILTAAAILVAAFIINFLVRRSIRLAVDRLVKSSEEQRDKAEREDGGGGPQQTADRLAAAALRRERAEQRTRTIGSLLRYVATTATV